MKNQDANDTEQQSRRLRMARPLTVEQVKQLLVATQEYPLKALVIIAVTTGLRRGELIGLRWQILTRRTHCFTRAGWSHGWGQ